MQRYFLKDIYDTQKKVYQVTGEAYHHMTRVMRMSTGDHVYLVFENEQAIEAEISLIDEQNVHLVEVRKEKKQKELPVHITIASGYPKGDKLEWIVQKTTELGVHQLIGFPAKTSIVKWDTKKLAKKQERLQKIAQEAAEQSHRQVAPTIHLLEDEQELVQQFDQYDGLLIAYEESAKEGEAMQLVQSFHQLKKGQKLLVLFGPEGGFTSDEIHVFQTAGAKLCGLGPRILRTETAPLYVLSAASFYFELYEKKMEVD